MRNKINPLAAFGMMIPLFIIGAIILSGLIVMLLWNGLMPDVFGLGIVTFWQALGLLVLGRFLFGGRKGKHFWRKKYHYANCKVDVNKNEDF